MKQEELNKKLYEVALLAEELNKGYMALHNAKIANMKRQSPEFFKEYKKELDKLNKARKNKK